MRKGNLDFDMTTISVERYVKDSSVKGRGIILLLGHKESSQVFESFLSVL